MHLSFQRAMLKDLLSNLMEKPFSKLTIDGSISADTENSDILSENCI